MSNTLHVGFINCYCNKGTLGIYFFDRAEKRNCIGRAAGGKTFCEQVLEIATKRQLVTNAEQGACCDKTPQLVSSPSGPSAYPINLQKNNTLSSGLPRIRTINFGFFHTFFIFISHGFKNI